MKDSILEALSYAPNMDLDPITATPDWAHHLHIVCGAFLLQKQTIWPAQLKIFTVQPFIEQVCRSLGECWARPGIIQFLGSAGKLADERPLVWSVLYSELVTGVAFVQITPF